MSLGYSYPCNIIRANTITHKLAATDVAGLLTMAQISKGITLCNLGPNTVFVSFEDEAVTVNSFPIPNGIMVPFPYVQTLKVRYICATGETADLRVVSEY